MPLAGFTSALEQRTRCVPRSSRPMVEARLETATDLRQTGGGAGSAPWGWQDADNWGAIAGSVEVLGDGGLRIKASGPSPFGSTVASSFYRSYEGGSKGVTPFIDPFTPDGQGGAGVMLTPGTLAGQRAFSGVQAWLHPRYDVTKPKYVRTWTCTLCRVIPRSGGVLGLFGSPGRLVTLAHGVARADNEVAAWVTMEFLDSAGLPFLFTPGGVLGGLPGVGVFQGQYVVFCHGYDARGQPATNIAWGYDPGNTSFAAGGSWTGITLAGVAGFVPSSNPNLQLFDGGVGAIIDLPALQFLSRSYSTTPVTITFKKGRNYCLQSQALATSPWFTTLLTAANNAVAAPDATTTATSLIPTAVSGQHIVEQSDPLTVGEYTSMSGYFKANGYTGVTMKVDGVTGNYTAAFDLTGAGAASLTADFGSGYVGKGTAITALANGWYYCQVWGTTGTDASLEPTIVVYDTYAHAQAQSVYTGNGTSGIYAWGIQFERNGSRLLPPMPYQPTTTAAVVGYRLDLGLVPATAPELELSAVTPSGTSVLGEVAPDPFGGATAGFVTFVDGQATSYVGPPPQFYTNLGLPTQRTYAVQATLQASADGARSPILYSIGARAVVAIDLGDVAEVASWQEHFDPMSHVGEIGEITIRAIHDGERDYRDAITRLLSENPPGKFYFRIYMGDRALPKAQWLKLNDFTPDDTDPRGADVGITCVCPLAQLRQALPKLTADTSGVPVSDVTNPGAWTASSGQTVGTGTVAGAQQIADVDALNNTGAPDDTMFIESPNNPSNAQYTAQLSAMSTPQQMVGIVMQVRAAVRTVGDSVNLKLELMEGATVRATLLPSGAPLITNADTGQGSYVPLQYQLTATEASNIGIGSWSALRIRFSATGTGHVRVGWARLVVLGMRAALQYPSSATPAATIATVMTDLIANQIGLDTRYRGIPYRDTAPAFPVSKVIATDASGATDLTRAKQELDWLAFIAGYVYTSFQGRIGCVPLYRVTPGYDPITASVTARFDPLPGPAAVALPREEILPLATAPGWRQRVGVYNVPWGWNGQLYAGEAQVISGATLLSFPAALVDPEQRAPAGISQWISGDGVARGVATRHAQIFALGEPEWRFRSSYAYPEWKVGDVQTIGIDQFIAYDPIAGQALKGYLSATGVLCGKWDAEGHEWSIWIQSLNALVPIGTAGALATAPATGTVGFSRFTAADPSRLWTYTNGYATVTTASGLPYLGYAHLTRDELPDGVHLRQLTALFWYNTTGAAGDFRAELIAFPNDGSAAVHIAVIQSDGSTPLGSWVTQSTAVDYIVDWTNNHYAIAVRLNSGIGGSVDNARFMWASLERDGT